MPPDSPDASTDTAPSRPVCADVTTTATTGGVLVAVTLRNDTAVDIRVRVENDLDGPVLPPRREGVPASGWDESGFAGTVPADSRLGIGYACPNADPDAGVDPISLEVLGPADEDDPSVSDHVADAVRSLGRAAPPADAVPTSPTVGLGAPPADHRTGCPGEPAESNSSSVPAPAAAWLDAVETRIERAERLTDATADEAAAVLEGCGVDGVADLPGDLDEDIAALRAAGDRIEELAARATAATPEPVASSLVDVVDADTSAAEGASGAATACRATDPGDDSARTQ